MELLFDDLWIDRKTGVKRVLGTVKRQPRIIQPEMPWEQGVSVLHSIMYDEEEKKFKLWYKTTLRAPGRGLKGPQAEESSERESGKRRHALCYAESQDGLKWERPSLGLFDYDGNRDNSILLETSEADSVFYNIIKDPSDPNPARRYKAIGFDRCASTLVTDAKIGWLGVCVAYSADGLRWPEGPKLIMSTSDLTDADCVLCRRELNTGKYVGFFRPRTHPKRRFVGYSESDDFDHWTYPRMLITPDLGDDEWIEYYGLIVAIIDQWRVGVLWVMHNNPECSPMTNELVYSRDGLHYHRAMPNQWFLPLGAPGSGESISVTSNSFFRHGPEFYLYYGASNHEHGSDRGQQMPPGRIAPGEQPRGGLGLARIPGMNFCGLRAEIDGLVETKWICNYGESGVQAYAEIDKDGWIRAEILDQYGSVIPGWDRSLSRVRQTEDGCLHFWWGRDELAGKYNQVSDAKGQIGHVVKLRFHLHKATLYAFGIGEEGAMPPYAA